mmetsp:Transcript_47400/g.115633  ORF Transcript_47400/g.115633 Transcript_47400/m.115633 type:complete len:122 (+) Transcript_47400:153-518(+)
MGNNVTNQENSLQPGATALHHNPLNSSNNGRATDTSIFDHDCRMNGSQEATGSTTRNYGSGDIKHSVGIKSNTATAITASLSSSLQVLPPSPRSTAQRNVERCRLPIIIVRWWKCIIAKSA